MQASHLFHLIPTTDVITYLTTPDAVLPVVSVNGEQGVLQTALSDALRRELHNVQSAAAEKDAANNVVRLDRVVPSKETTEDLKKRSPSLHGHCALLLPWTSVRLPEDLAAVFHLEPSIVVVIYDTFGNAAGSPWLLHWLATRVDGSAELTQMVDRVPEFKTAEQQDIWYRYGATRRYCLVAMMRKAVTMEQTNCMILLRRSDVYLQEERTRFLRRA